MDIRPPSLPSVKIPPKNQDDKAEAKQESQKGSPLFSLSDAVKNNEETEAALALMGEKDQVQKANEESSASDIRDVERAADLANRVSRRIESDPGQAVSAQANQKPDTVRRLLS